MHWFDLLIVGLIGWSVLSAFRRGLVRELIGIAGLVLGVILAGRYYDELSANLAFAIEHDVTRDLASFAAIFAGINLVAAIASSFARGAATLFMLGPVDRVGGAAFGALKGVLLIEAVVVVVTAFPAAATVAAAAEESTLAPLFLRAAPLINNLLPEDFHESIEGLRALA